MRLRGKADYERYVARSRAKRIRWWTEARFGLFVHWGLYSLIGRNEWVQALECIPAKDYEALASRFRPRPRAAREWARLARDAGMKYAVMTTKHHDGFCLWDTAQTDYNAAKTACGRDLVAEFVEACREYGLRTGFYYSLMDWHHADCARAGHDPTARRRFLEFTNGCLNELMTRYGRIDVLWYDGARPMRSHEGWTTVAMNQRVRALQPGILINDRARLAEDFATPEERVQAAEDGRAWEACMTLNGASWGYMPSAARDTRSARDILKMLNTACEGAGNLLLNIGPAPDGSVVTEESEPLETVGKWLARNGRAVYGTLDSAPRWASACGGFSRRGSDVFFWCRSWPGRKLVLGGFGSRLRSARFLDGGKSIDFEQLGHRILLQDMPARSPDRIAGVTVIHLEFASPVRHAPHPDTPVLQA